MDVMEGKTGIGGKNRKDIGEHKFWKTQPVPQLGEGLPDEDGPIEPSKPVHEVKQEPDALPKEFEWSTVVLEDPAQSKEVYELLSANYVEDHDASFRFQYSAEFLRWAMMPPGYHPEWHLGVRVKSTKKLVAFISGIPVTLKVRDRQVSMSEINFLCVHKKLRSKRLAPVLIKEVTRQCHLKGIFQAIYTAGVVLPTPVSTCRYFHRSINIPKLVDCGFTYVPRNSTLARLVIRHKLAATTTLKGLREMEHSDLPAVKELWERYVQRFKMLPMYTEDELRHNLLSGRGEGEPSMGRRKEQVVWSYVVENPVTHKITDFFTFYFLPSQVVKSTPKVLLEAAYLFYYATDVAFEENAGPHGLIKRRLMDLIGDALIIADQAKFDVFNALTLMDNDLFLTDLKFGPGDGYLNYYLYNWRTAPLEGFKALPANQGGGNGVGRGVAVVML
ncbi:N-myristoyl transferase [Clavulina sp. PMI_390]|nr:N-myristoyl transferase [Clavulina sp. PMI_390]